MKPHEVQGWLNPGCSSEELSEGSKEICDVYLNATQNWEESKIKTISCDEKTGMQALERASPDLPTKSGCVRKQEYEYIRHGTQYLTANWDVSEGRIIAPTIAQTRTEEDFQKHVQQTVESNNEVNKWCIVVDNLETYPHINRALVFSEAPLGVSEKINFVPLAYVNAMV